LARIHGTSTIASLVRSDSGEQIEQQVCGIFIEPKWRSDPPCISSFLPFFAPFTPSSSVVVPLISLLQEVAAAAENKRIFSPLGGPMPAPQATAAAEEWALDVVAKGAFFERCFALVRSAKRFSIG
jgi:hypothetical protein